jgi:hypothetical protein
MNVTVFSKLNASTAIDHANSLVHSGSWLNSSTFSSIFPPPKPHPSSHTSTLQWRSPIAYYTTRTLHNHPPKSLVHQHAMVSSPIAHEKEVYKTEMSWNSTYRTEVCDCAIPTAAWRRCTFTCTWPLIHLRSLMERCHYHFHTHSLRYCCGNLHKPLTYVPTFQQFHWNWIGILCTTNEGSHAAKPLPYLANLGPLAMHFLVNLTLITRSRRPNYQLGVQR